MAVDKTIAQYKDFSQLQEFAQAQQTTIVQLSKKLEKLEQEKDHYKKLAESPVKVVPPGQVIPKGTSDEDSEQICNMEIAKLRGVSTMRELTLEESRKLDTYFRILQQIKASKKSTEREVDKLGEEELLKIVESQGNGTK